MSVIFSFSGQFSSLAVDTMCWFTLHSMVYFFNHYELPAVAENEEEDEMEDEIDVEEGVCRGGADEDVGLVGENE